MKNKVFCQTLQLVDLKFVILYYQVWNNVDELTRSQVNVRNMEIHVFSSQYMKHRQWCYLSMLSGPSPWYRLQLVPFRDRYWSRRSNSWLTWINYWSPRDRSQSELVLIKIDLEWKIWRLMQSNKWSEVSLNRSVLPVHICFSVPMEVGIGIAVRIFSIHQVESDQPVEEHRFIRAMASTWDIFSSTTDFLMRTSHFPFIGPFRLSRRLQGDVPVTYTWWTRIKLESEFSVYSTTAHYQTDYVFSSIWY